MLDFACVLVGPGEGNAVEQLPDLGRGEDIGLAAADLQGRALDRGRGIAIEEAA